VKTFELEDATTRKLQELSKGAIQRAILVFSMLYGSKSLMMDEPVFALEEYQRERALEFLSDYSHETGTPVFYSLHELEYSKRFADYGLLFYRDGRTPYLAPVEEAFTPERIEEAYEYPPAMLDRHEYLFREQLLRSSEAR
jgi:iron complex transport system ATP-binding protein